MNPLPENANPNPPCWQQAMAEELAALLIRGENNNKSSDMGLSSSFFRKKLRSVGSIKPL